MAVWAVFTGDRGASDPDRISSCRGTLVSTVFQFLKHSILIVEVRELPKHISYRMSERISYRSIPLAERISHRCIRPNRAYQLSGREGI